MKQRIRLIYILAASHSGSTLLAMLLGSHPEICTVGEIKFTSLGDIDRYLCSCHKKIRECSFWNRITQDMAERGFSFDIANAGTDYRSGTTPYVSRLLRPLHRGPVFEKIRDIALTFSPNWRYQLHRVHAANTNLIQCILARTGKKVIVDSSKIGIRLKYLLRNPSLDVRVIRLIRDGRGVTLAHLNPSLYADAQNPHHRGGGMGENINAEHCSVDKAANLWRSSNVEADAILKQLEPNRFTEVRYETLCKYPYETLYRLSTFSGVNPGKMIINFRSIEHHIVGNGMRLDLGDDINLDEKWRSDLTKADLAVFDSICGKLNTKYGYV